MGARWFCCPSVPLLLNSLCSQSRGVTSDHKMSMHVIPRRHILPPGVNRYTENEALSERITRDPL